VFFVLVIVLKTLKNRDGYAMSRKARGKKVRLAAGRGKVVPPAAGRRRRRRA